MSELFLKIVNMSISASWLVLVVLTLRFIFKKAPKWVNVLLWGIVAVRLVCPFSIESALSLIPSAETISPEIMMDWTPEISTGIESVDRVVNPIITETFAPEPIASANPLQILIPIFSAVWLIGVAAFVIYTAISYWRLQRKVSEAVILRDNIYQSENVSSPFVLGIIKPKIYLPYHMDDQDLEHVVAHEHAHIRRRDHWWKPLGFLLLTIHWFNPLMWLAYVLLCRDIELACDEKVIKEMGNEQRADYTQALVSCSVNRRMIAACPLAFGEVGVKERVKSVLNYKKPAFWVVVASVIACVVVAVCFLTNPAAEREFPINGSNVSELDTAYVLEKIAEAERLESVSQLCANADNFDLMFTPDFNWANDGAIRFFYGKNEKTYSAQLRMFHDDNKYFITKRSEWLEQDRIFKLGHYLDALKYIPQEEVRQLSPDADGYSVMHVDYGGPSDFERVLTYSTNGVTDLEEWYIHLTVEPLHEVNGAYNGSGDEVIHLFYGHEDSDDALASPDGDSASTNAAPIVWTYSPMMSATWHAAFHFNFDLANYSHIEASCDNGTLWNLRAQGQPRDKTMRFEQGEPLCWMPGVGDSLTDTAESAKVTFTVYDGGEIVAKGAFDIVRTGTENGQSFYEAQLTDTQILALAQEPGSLETFVILAGNGTIVSYSDVNHNRINERVIVREAIQDMLYELCVVEDGAVIWSAEAGTPHVGWNTIMLYEEDGKSYLVEYHPTMYQGAGSYRCTVFSINGGEKVIQKEWAVDFERPLEETPEMEQFAREVNELLRKSAVLLSTEQGILVDKWAEASSLPQLYPVRFEPDEIQQAIEAAANPTAPQELTANAAEFPDVPLDLIFASGAGAWGTYLTLQPDGRFIGDYGDSDTDTRYECKFEGRFTDIRQISDYCWAMKLGDVTIEKKEGTTWIEDGIHYIAAGPHGVSGGTDFLLYAPGTPVDLIPAECRNWWPDAYRWRNGELDQLDGWGLCNVNTGNAFFQSTTSKQTVTGEALTDEKLTWFNEIFYPIVYDKQGNPISVNPVSGFFSSYYDDVRNMDFEEFMRYFPEDGSFASDAEFEALKTVEAWPFDWVETRDDMPVPIHKYQARIVDMVLKENAGITTADLDTSDVAYLPEYDAYYNYTSDFGPGMFTCTRGEVIGDIVRLYEEFETGTDMLTLRKVGNNYQIVAHQCLEGDNNAERVYGR